MSSRRRGERRREPSPARSRHTRIYYDRALLLHHLQQLCPEGLRFFPHPASFMTYRGISHVHEDQPLIALLEIGRVRSTDPDRDPYQLDPEPLCVWDRGGFNSDAPDLIPYSSQGGPSERHIVDANSFSPTGIFAELRENRTPRLELSLDDPLVASLLQFIMILRNNRRYYWYGDRHWESPQEHLQPLVQALLFVTLRARRIHPRGSPAPLYGGGMRSQQSLRPLEGGVMQSHQPSSSFGGGGMQSQQLLPTFNPRRMQRRLPPLTRPPESPMSQMPTSSPMPPRHQRPPHIDPTLRVKDLLLSTIPGPINAPSPQDSVLGSDAANDTSKNIVLVTTEPTDGTMDDRDTTGEFMHNEARTDSETLSPLSEDQTPA